MLLRENENNPVFLRWKFGVFTCKGFYPLERFNPFPQMIHWRNLYYIFAEPELLFFLLLLFVLMDLDITLHFGYFWLAKR